MNKPLYNFKIYFSYGQFIVYDISVSLPACDWSAEHTNQGFARQESNASFRTIENFGQANVSVYLNEFILKEEFQRVISVPFYSSTGKIKVEGPEEFTNSIVIIQPGPYKLYAAQWVINEENENIELFFQKLEIPATKSEIIKADEEIKPPAELLEYAESA